jgi:SAM-dependent methyltransferase
MIAQSNCMYAPMRLSVFALCLLLAACAVPVHKPKSFQTLAREKQETPSPTALKLRAEAQALAPLVQSALARDFLAATASLPGMAARTVFVNPARRYFSRAAAAALPEKQRAALKSVELDEYRYYYTKYGSPLAYVRAVELLSQQGIASFAGRRILDYGYGTVGHLRLLASLGADAVGVDVDSYVAALYSEPGDIGTVPGRRGGPPGTIKLVNGRYPGDKEVAARVGGGFDIIISKNTLKRGYLKPARPAEQRLLIQLGVSDAVFLNTISAALRRGGIFLIYNIAPAPAPRNKPYIPWADARSPFTQKQFEAAGLRVVAFDMNDDVFVRSMGRALGWHETEKRDDRREDFSQNLFALYTIVVKI